MPQPAARLAFDIPSQPLVSALDAYSAASGVQVLYDTGLASDHRSAPLKGAFTPPEALKTLLAGTGLVGQYTGQNDAAVVVVSVQEAARRVLPPLDGMVLSLETLHVEPDTALGQADDEDFHRYSAVVQGDVQKLLDRNALTLSGSYSVGIELWVDPAGAVLRSQIFRSTGDRDRDGAISRTLNKLAISEAPPSDMPQPVKVVIVAHHL